MIGGLDAAARARRRQVEQLPDLLHLLARALRGGHTLHRAIVRVAADEAAGDEFRRAARRVGDGAPVHGEIDRWAAALHHPDADLVRAVVNTGASTGSALASSFDRAAATLHERAELHREIRVLTAQARASALLLTLAPLVLLGVVAVADPGVVGASLASGVGRFAVAAGLVLDVAGWAWMSRLAEAVDP